MTTILVNVLPDEITDFRVFKEGMIFPLLDKKIHILISVEASYIVFLDEEFYVHWYYNSLYNSDYGDFVEDDGDILANQADLEATSRLLLKNSHLEAHGRLLGEAIARMLDNQSQYAKQTLKKAADFLEARSVERARIWFLSATLTAAVAFLLFGLVFWKQKDVILTFLALSHTSADVFVGATMGSLGALISVLLRSNKLHVDPSAGARVHYFEGVMRVLIGALAGMLFVLAIKSNILLGTLNQSQNVFAILVVLSIVAGASEQLLPNLINQISSILVRGTKKVEIIEVEDSNLPDDEVKDETLSAAPPTNKLLPSDKTHDEKENYDEEQVPGEEPE
jgi:hypothetical protein